MCRECGIHGPNSVGCAGKIGNLIPAYHGRFLLHSAPLVGAFFRFGGAAETVNHTRGCLIVGREMKLG
jgi:hypothetical protein